MVGPLTIKLGVLWWRKKHVNDNKQSEAIYTCYFLYGHYAPKLHVRDVKKERRQVN